jgi:putative permease
MKNNSHIKNHSFKVYMFYIWVLLGLVFLYTFPRITLPMGFAYVLSLIIEPFKANYFKLSVKKRKWFILAGISFFVIALFPILRLIGKITEEVGKINVYIPKIELFVTSTFFKVQMFLLQNFKYRVELDIAKEISGKLAKSGQDIIVYIPSLFGSILEWFFLVPLFLFFFFREKKLAKDLFFSMVPNHYFEKVYVLVNQFNKKFGDYIVAKFLEATIVGLLVYTGLVIIHFPSPAFLAIVAGASNILPYIGPLIGFIPAVVIYLIENDPNLSILPLIIVFIITNAIDMILVFPLMVSKIVNLHPILVIISVIVGSQLGGVIGMIIAVPVMAIIKIVFDEIYKDTYLQG